MRGQPEILVECDGEKCKAKEVVELRATAHGNYSEDHVSDELRSRGGRMKAKYDRPRTNEVSPQPLDFHSHEVVWHSHGFRIVQRCYCKTAAEGMAKFQRRMGNDAQAVKVGV
jgi:hypothetical protein